MKIIRGLKELMSRVRAGRQHVERTGSPLGDACHVDAGDPRRRLIETKPDMTTCAEITNLLSICRQSVREGAACLAIDLRNVQSADTKLIACLVGVYQMAKASSVRLELFVSRQVIEMADICRLRSLLERTLPRE